MVLSSPNLNKLLDSLDFPVWCINKDYTLIYFNSSFLSAIIKSHKIKVYLGFNMIDFIRNNKTEYEYWKNVYDSVFDTGETNVTTLNYELNYFKVSIQPIYEKDKSINFVVGIIEDITFMKKVENELTEKNKSLEQFAYITAHDLKTPIRSLSGLVNILLKYIGKNRNGVKIIKIIELITDNSIKMSEIIDDTLSYSRASKELKLEKYLIRESVNTAISNLSYNINKDVKINNLINGLYIEADRGQINQLFQNLISNAIKFNNKDKKIVNIGYLPNDKGFYVEDNGIGIDNKYIDKIFKMFQRLDTNKDGTGIGLAIVDKVVNNHNWTIDVDSVLGKGSIFKIKINN